MEKLFIYGTLAPGRPNEHKLSDIEGTWQKAKVKGKLKAQGWGSDMGYPGITLDENASYVEGFIFSSNDLYKKWQMLDEFEGSEYKRVLTKVELEDKTFIEAYIYELNN